MLSIFLMFFRLQINQKTEFDIHRFRLNVLKINRLIIDMDGPFIGKGTRVLKTVELEPRI
jgi:hypothetical protein